LAKEITIELIFVFKIITKRTGSGQVHIGTGHIDEMVLVKLAAIVRLIDNLQLF